MANKLDHSPTPWKWVPSEHPYPCEGPLGKVVDANGEEVMNFGDNTQYYPTQGSEPSEGDLKFMLRAVNALPTDVMKCVVDLTKTDEYENRLIPDSDFEIALKVLRTVRNCCLGPNFFDADGAVVLSHAHAKLTELCQLAIEGGEHGQ